MLILGSGLKTKRSSHIAVVEMEGTIGTRLKASEYVKLLHDIENNEGIKAVVLDVDSPGGSASASNYLYLAVSALTRKKPVVSFIRGVGASGAYLFSCPASRIVAIPSALVGSIGVISLHPLLHDALGRIGVDMHVTKSDKFKDMGSMFREPTPEEVAKEQELVDDLYDQFLESVASGRNMDMAQAKSVATGEVYTARKALTLGLVDELGDLERAIDLAAELSGAPRSPVWLHPKKNLRDAVASLMASAFVGEIESRLDARISSQFLYQYRP